MNDEPNLPFECTTPKKFEFFNGETRIGFLDEYQFNCLRLWIVKNRIETVYALNEKGEKMYFNLEGNPKEGYPLGFYDENNKVILQLVREQINLIKNKNEN